MGGEYFGVVTFDLGPLLQGQTKAAKLKSAYNFRNLQPLCVLLCYYRFAMFGVHHWLTIMYVYMYGLFTYLCK